MSDHLETVRKYAPNADEGVVAKIVKHLGIALQKQDSARVAVSDRAELDRIRDGFCTKTLKLDPEVAEAAIQAVAKQMKGDTAKSRVAFYYLLAEKTGSLNRFV